MSHDMSWQVKKNDYRWDSWSVCRVVHIMDAGCGVASFCIPSAGIYKHVLCTKRLYDENPKEVLVRTKYSTFIVKIKTQYHWKIVIFIHFSFFDYQTEINFANFNSLFHYFSSSNFNYM